MIDGGADRRAEGPEDRGGDAPPRPARALDAALALAALAATVAFVLWAPNGARAVGAWLGFAP